MDESNPAPQGLPGAADITFLPPFTNRGVESGGVSVAWLQASRPAEDDRVAAMRLAMDLGGPSATGRPIPHYERAIRSDRGLWTVGYCGQGDARGTVAVTLRQSWWEAVGDPGPWLVRLLTVDGFHASRVDLAGDDLRPDAPRPRAYFDRRALAWTRTHRDRWVYREDGAGRQTLNVGAGTSDRQARIYDHAPGCLRHELELRRDVARAAGAALAAGERPAVVWAAEYGRLVRWPNE